MCWRKCPDREWHVIMGLLCGFVWAQFSYEHKLNSTGEFQQLQVTMHSFSFPQINQKQTREWVCSDSLLFWPWMPVSSIYLELKQSVLVAQGQEMKTKLVSNVLWDRDPAHESGEPTSVRRNLLRRRETFFFLINLFSHCMRYNCIKTSVFFFLFRVFRNKTNKNKNWL